MRVLGRVEKFRDRLQLDVRTLEAADVDPATLTPAIRRDASELQGFLEYLIEEVSHPGLGATVRAVLTDRDLAAFPATADDHHSYAGGLLEHTVGVATLCRETAQLHPRLRSELVLAAALVHDVGRTLELSRGPAFALTEEGRLLGPRPPRDAADRGARGGARRVAAGRAPALRRRAPRCARVPDGRGRGAVPRERARRERRHPADRVNELLLALGASLAWGVADFVGPWQGRALGALRVLLWAQLAGVAALAVALAVRGEATHDAAVLRRGPGRDLRNARPLRLLPRDGHRSDGGRGADRGRVRDRSGRLRDPERRPAIRHAVRAGSRARSWASCSPRRSTRRPASGDWPQASAWR